MTLSVGLQRAVMTASTSDSSTAALTECYMPSWFSGAVRAKAAFGVHVSD
jgi:hypothetical protein